MRSYEGWTLPALKKELKKRGAKISGRKADLVDRLEAYDRNENFGTYVDDAVGTWNMDLPDTALYKDISSNSMIEITTNDATSYLDPHEVKLGEKSKKLYQERFLRYAKSCVYNDHVFVRMQCRAEMKKTVTYDLDIQLCSHGGIVACQCDCTAGLGPSAHCKHIRTGLFGLIEFVLSRTINVELACTDKIQKFHRPKSLHAGSPVKSQNLGIISDKNILFDPLEDYTDETDEEYKSRFRNVIINDSVNRKESVPLLQLFSPANSHAIDLDHDYLKIKQSEAFLENENITKISTDTVKHIELFTRGQAKNPKWLLERGKRIQSSNFGKVSKATDRRDLDKLAAEFMTSKDLSNVPAVRHGINNEDDAIQQYESLTSNIVTRMGLLVDEDCPFLGTSVDGISGDIVVEVKCPYASRGKSIDHLTVPYLMKTDEGQGLQLSHKHDYYYQVQGQLHITKKKICHFVIYTITDIEIIEIPVDREFINLMIGKLHTFFNDHFKPVYLNKYFFKEYYKYKWDQMDTS